MFENRALMNIVELKEEEETGEEKIA